MVEEFGAIKSEYEKLGDNYAKISCENDAMTQKLKETEMSAAVLYEVIDNFYKINMKENSNDEELKLIPKKAEIESFIRNRFYLDKYKEKTQGKGKALNYSIQLDKTLCNKSLKSLNQNVAAEERVVQTEKKKSRKKSKARNLSAVKVR
jgi:hypothetical protein